MKPAPGTVLYLSGPMTGREDLNRPAFAAAAAALRAIDYRVVNPHELHAGDTTWEQAMRTDVKALMDCDAVALLPGWRDSHGATIESWLACCLGMPLLTVGELLPQIVFVNKPDANTYEQADFTNGFIYSVQPPVATQVQEVLIQLLQGHQS